MGEKGGRKGIPPTESLVERFWGLGRSQETVVAPSQASHRAALGHPVTDRQTHQMAWLGQTDRDLFIFHPLVVVGDCSAQAVYWTFDFFFFHVSAFTWREYVNITLTCI